MKKKVNKNHSGVEKYNRILQVLIQNARKNDFKYDLKDFQVKAINMYKVEVSEYIITYCKNQVEQYNFGKRKEANGNKEQQFIGIVGQCVLMQLFNCGLVDGRTGFDNGIDIQFENHKIDIKTMGRNTDVKLDYTNNFIKFQENYQTTTYIFCSYNIKSGPQLPF